MQICKYAIIYEFGIVRKEEREKPCAALLYSMDDLARFVTPVIAFFVVVFYLVYLINDSILQYIALIPANTLLANTFIWNLATSCLLETNILRVIIDVVLLLPVMRFDSFAPMDQFALYLIFTILACSVLTSCWFFYRFFSTGEWEHLTEQVYGYGGIIMALLMFKVLKCPNEQLIINNIPISFKYVPTLIVSVQVLLWLLGIRFLSVDVSYTSTAYVFCWCYLRYYYHFESNETGNKSEDFRFIEMYPPVRRYLVILADLLRYCIL